MGRRGWGGTVLVHGLLAVATLVAVFPIIYALQVSTLTFQEVFAFPPKMTPGNAFLDNLARA
jgi:ABC-type glycerol-3-phosphate transport system permease component